MSISVTMYASLFGYAGSIFSIGVLAKAAAFDRVWETSIAFMALVSAPSMILAGVYLDKDDAEDNLIISQTVPKKSAKTKRARLLIALSGFGFAALSAGYADSVRLIRFAVAIQGFPLGVLYLLGNELLANWIHEAPGFGIGLGQTAFGFGIITFSGVFSFLISSSGALSITLSAVLLAVPTWLIGCFIQFPDNKHDSLSTTAQVTDEETGPQLEEKAVKVPWKKLVTGKSFWLYMGIVFSSQAGFAFTPFFFEIGTGFGKPMSLVVNFFQLANLLNTIARLGTGAVTDYFRISHSRRFSSGSKNVLQIAFLVQAALFAVMIPMSNQGQFLACMFTMSVLLVIYGAVNCSCTILARDMFSPKNSATVFGIGAGLMMGLGEAFAASVAGWLIGKWGAGPRHSGFTMYYAMASVWSLAGLFVAMLIMKCERSFQRSGVRDPLLSARDLKGDYAWSHDHTEARLADVPIASNGGTCFIDGRSRTTYNSISITA